VAGSDRLWSLMRPALAVASLTLTVLSAPIARADTTDEDLAKYARRRRRG